MRDETPWNPVLAFVRVNQSPDDGFEVTRRKVVRLLVDTFVYEQVALLLAIPNNWLLFSKAST
jgi:hypothetical protein